jgi:hypothetical protein
MPHLPWGDCQRVDDLDETVRRTYNTWKFVSPLTFAANPYHSRSLSHSAQRPTQLPAGQALLFRGQKQKGPAGWRAPLFLAGGLGFEPR